MDKALKEKWLAALRSGEYSQATSVLKDKSGGYCCLGVLCEVEGTLEQYWWEEEGRYDHVITPKHGESLGLWGNISEEAVDFVTRHSGYIRTTYWEALITMNDNDVPFDKIADFIEEHV